MYEHWFSSYFFDFFPMAPSADLAFCLEPFFFCVNSSNSSETKKINQAVLIICVKKFHMKNFTNC